MTYKLYVNLFQKKKELRKLKLQREKKNEKKSLWFSKK